MLFIQGGDMSGYINKESNEVRENVVGASVDRKFNGIGITEV